VNRARRRAEVTPSNPGLSDPQSLKGPLSHPPEPLCAIELLTCPKAPPVCEGSPKMKTLPFSHSTKKPLGLAANAGATLIASITTIRATTLNNTRMRFTHYLPV
jgi:hypothetical protein